MVKCMIVSGKNNKNGRAIMSTLFMKRSLSFQSEFISAQCILIFLLLMLWHLKSNYWVWASGWSGIRLSKFKFFITEVKDLISYKSATKT